MKIKHDLGGVKLPKYKLFFPKGKYVEVEDEALAEKILRNPAFSAEGSSKKSKKKEEKKTITSEVDE